MGKLKVTPGKWQVVDTYDEDRKIIVWDGDEQAHQPVCDMGEIGDMNYREAEANAILIANAGKTYNKCKNLPSELLQQRDELLAWQESAKLIIEQFIDDTHHYEMNASLLLEAEVLIQKI